MSLKYQSPLSFDYLEQLSKQGQGQIKEDVIPFIPKDYNKSKFQFEFSQEYLEDLQKEQHTNLALSDQSLKQAVDLVVEEVK